MDLNKLETIINEKELITEDLFNFFELESKEEAVSLWKDNLSQVKVKWNDDIGYQSLQLLYGKVSNDEDNNIFYQELMKHSLFLRTFSGFNMDIVTAFVNMIGVLEFVFITRSFLKELPEYRFFEEMYDEYKKDLRFMSEWNTSKELFDLVEVGMKKDIDMEKLNEATKTLEEMKEEFMGDKKES